MKRPFLSLLVALTALGAWAQAPEPLVFSGPIRFDYVNDGSAAQAPVLATDVSDARAGSLAYIAWSTDDATFTAAEFKAGTSVAGAQRGEAPTQAQTFAYIGIWLSGTAWDDVVAVYFGGPNSLNLLAPAEALTIDGVAGQYRRLVARQSGPQLGGTTISWDF